MGVCSAGHPSTGAMWHIAHDASIAACRACSRPLHCRVCKRTARSHIGPGTSCTSHTSAAVYLLSRPRFCLSAFLQALPLAALPLVELSTTSSHSSDTVINSKMNFLQVRSLYRTPPCKRYHVRALSDASLAQRHGSCSTHAPHSRQFTVSCV